MNSLRRILANIIYTGSIQHHGKPYPGEHAAILVPGTWERVQTLIAQRPAVARGRARNKHLALLNGLLFCESCAHAHGVHVRHEERPQVSLLCVLECAAQGLGGMSRQIAPAARHRGIGSGANQGRADRNLRCHVVGTDGSRAAGRGDTEGSSSESGYDGTAHQISIRFRPIAGAEGAFMSGVQEITYAFGGKRAKAAPACS